MKTTINAFELVEFNACSDGLQDFVNYHTDKTVNLSDCFKSNLIEDIFWLLQKLEINNLLSATQLKDLRLFACDCAESVLHIFEKDYPDDKRPRQAIQTARDFANGLVSKETLKKARSAAYSAEHSASSYAARNAADSARYSTKNSASSAAYSTIEKEQTDLLKKLFLKWEREV
jgi:hypothetical protein